MATINSCNYAPTQYRVQCGGANGSLSDVSSTGTSGQVLTSNGPGALPTFQTISATGAFTRINRQVFTSNGTYTPTSGMVYCDVEMVGGGGGGGGTAATSTTTMAAAGGGGGAEYGRGIFTAATIGASQSVTVGTGGAGGTAGANDGSLGGTSSLGALLTAVGGGGGKGKAAAAFGNAAGGVGGNSGTGGDYHCFGGYGMNSFFELNVGVEGIAMSGRGGASFFGEGAQGQFTSAPGGVGLVYGAGGSGACGYNDTSVARAGGSGKDGVVIITEYISD